jgi:hypothetical protein
MGRYFSVYENNRLQTVLDIEVINSQRVYRAWIHTIVCHNLYKRARVKRSKRVNMQSRISAEAALMPVFSAVFPVNIDETTACCYTIAIQ